MRPLLVDALAGLVGRELAFYLAPSFFMLGALAVLAAAVLAVRLAGRQGFDRRLVLTALMALYVGTIAGGIVIPMLVDAAVRFARGGALHLRWAGMVSFAGHAGGLLGAYLVVRRARVSWPGYLDLMAAPAALGLCVARLGCFVAGCDYGQVTSSPLALRFPAGSPAWHAHVDAGLLPSARAVSLPVHPTQLYEAALGLVLCLAVLVLLPRLERRFGALPVGARFYAVGVGYALGRLGIETLRGDASRGVFGAISTGQVLSVVVLALAATLLWRARRRALVVALVLLAPLPARAEWSLAGELGTASPMNRREGQVPNLSGGRVNLGWPVRHDLDVVVSLGSLANGVARHNSLQLGGVHHQPLGGSRWSWTASLFFGYTFVNWIDPTFEDIPATSTRLAGGLDWALSERLTLSIAPLGLEYVMGRDLGGPIVSYTFTLGLSLRFGASAPAPAQPMLPLGPLPTPPT